MRTIADWGSGPSLVDTDRHRNPRPGEVGGPTEVPSSRSTSLAGMDGHDTVVALAPPPSNKAARRGGRRRRRCRRRARVEHAARPRGRTTASAQRTRRGPAVGQRSPASGHDNPQPSGSGVCGDGPAGQAAPVAVVISVVLVGARRRAARSASGPAPAGRPAPSRVHSPPARAAVPAQNHHRWWKPARAGPRRRSARRGSPPAGRRRTRRPPGGRSG